MIWIVAWIGDVFVVHRLIDFLILHFGFDVAAQLADLNGRGCWYHWGVFTCAPSSIICCRLFVSFGGVVSGGGDGAGRFRFVFSNQASFAKCMGEYQGYEATELSRALYVLCVTTLPANANQHTKSSQNLYEMGDSELLSFFDHLPIVRWGELEKTSLFETLTQRCLFWARKIAMTFFCFWFSSFVITFFNSWTIGTTTLSNSSFILILISSSLPTTTPDLTPPSDQMQRYHWIIWKACA